MALEIIPNERPYILHFRVSNQLTDSDLAKRYSESFQGDALYVLIDVSSMSFQLPVSFLTKADQVALLRHPALRHIAVYTPSGTMRRFLQIVSKALNITNISVHLTREKALQHVDALYNAHQM
jgi:hypothetical protein